MPDSSSLLAPLLALCGSIPLDCLQLRFMQQALLGLLLLCPMTAALGVQVVHFRMAFFSDALGHSALTGIALGVILGIDNELISMVAFGILLALIITKVRSAGTASADTVISVFSSAAIALGLVILSVGGGFSKYSSYLIGDVLSVTSSEILILAVTLICVTVIWALIYNKLTLVSINRELAASRGVKVALIENIFVVLVAVVVMLSIKWVGVLLINSMLILPAACARNFSTNSRQYLFSSVAISLAAGIGGVVSSFYLNTSAGATIVIVSAVLFFISYIFRKKK